MITGNLLGAIKDYYTINTHLLSNFSISLYKVALLFGPVGNMVLNFNDALTSRLKYGIQTINDPHSAGFVSTALPDMHRLSHNTAKVLVAPTARIRKAFSKKQWSHLDLLSN